jgi:hypothetical protein
LAQEFGGNHLVLKVTEKEAKDLYVKHESALEEDQDSETTVSLGEERLEPRTKQIMEEATIVKEPLSGLGGFIVSLVVAYVSTKYSTDNFSNSALTEIAGFLFSKVIFAILFHLDNRKKYTKKFTGRLTSCFKTNRKKDGIC